MCQTKTLQRVLPILNLCSIYTASSDDGTLQQHSNFLLGVHPYTFFPSCSAAPYKNILLPLFADLSKKEAQGLPGGIRLFVIIKWKIYGKNNVFFVCQVQSVT